MMGACFACQLAAGATACHFRHASRRRMAHVGMAVIGGVDRRSAFLGRAGFSGRYSAIDLGCRRATFCTFRRAPTMLPMVDVTAEATMMMMARQHRARRIKAAMTMPTGHCRELSHDGYIASASTTDDIARERPQRAISPSPSIAGPAAARAESRRRWAKAPSTMAAFRRARRQGYCHAPRHYNAAGADDFYDAVYLLRRLRGRADGAMMPFSHYARP